jgi:hypothetical protein
MQGLGERDRALTVTFVYPPPFCLLLLLLLLLLFFITFSHFLLFLCPSSHTGVVDNDKHVRQAMIMLLQHTFPLISEVFLLLCVCVYVACVACVACVSAPSHPPPLLG